MMAITGDPPTDNGESERLETICGKWGLSANNLSLSGIWRRKLVFDKDGYVSPEIQREYRFLLGHVRGASHQLVRVEGQFNRVVGEILRELGLDEDERVRQARGALSAARGVLASRGHEEFVLTLERLGKIFSDINHTAEEGPRSRVGPPLPSGRQDQPSLPPTLPGDGADADGSGRDRLDLKQGGE